MRTSSVPCQRESLDGRHLAGAGAIASLEAKLADYFGMRYALAVSSATTGMLALALALEIRDRDVVVPAFAHGASVAGWLLTGNRLRFADVTPSTLTLDPRAAAAQVTSRTAVLVAVDWLGNPADTLGLRRVADEHQLIYISDSAQALSARRCGRPAGSSADAVVVSFTTGKDLDVGEGGAILTNRSDLYERLVWHTQHPHRQHRDLALTASNTFGLNGRMHPLSAVLADNGFRASIEKAHRRTARIQAALASLVESGTIEATRLAGNDIQPSFFRVPVACRGEAQRREVVSQAAKLRVRLSIDSTPLRVLYQDPSLALHRRQVVMPVGCAAAERASRRTSVFVH